MQPEKVCFYLTLFNLLILLTNLWQRLEGIYLNVLSSVFLELMLRLCYYIDFVSLFTNFLLVH